MRTALVLSISLAATLAAGSTSAVAPDLGLGEFVYYLDASGNVVGYRAIRCDGTPESWGFITKRSEGGVFLCEPDV